MLKKITIAVDAMGGDNSPQKIIDGIELHNKKSKNVFYKLINPERQVSEDAIKVHGYTNKRLEKEPKFKDIADELVKFIAGKKLIIHNAPFDIGFLNHELKKINMKIIDHTLTIADNIPTFPGSPKPNFIKWQNIERDGYNLELLFLSSHTGTHIDAPFHFLKDGKKIHEIPPERLVNEAILIKIRKKSNQAILKTDIQKFEKKFGKIDDGSTVIFHTGWQKNLNKKSYFLKNPGLAVSAAKYLVTKKINLVGIDSPSIDLGSDSKFSVHQILAKNNILIVENLANLDKINSNEFHLITAPLKLKNGTGSPIRAFGFVDS